MPAVSEEIVAPCAKPVPTQSELAEDLMLVCANQSWLVCEEEIELDSTTLNSYNYELYKWSDFWKLR